MHKLNSILLIDDDDINNYINERLIKKLNVSNDIKIAFNGKEGIDFIKERLKNNTECPELILLDINMPVMDGFEFLKEFELLPLSNKNKVNITILTSSQNNKDMETLRALGNFDFINKPLTEEKLFNCLIKAVSH